MLCEYKQYYKIETRCAIDVEKKRKEIFCVSKVGFMEKILSFSSECYLMGGERNVDLWLTKWPTHVRFLRITFLLGTLLSCQVTHIHQLMSIAGWHK